MNYKGIQIMPAASDVFDISERFTRPSVYPFILPPVTFLGLVICNGLLVSPYWPKLEGASTAASMLRYLLNPNGNDPMLSQYMLLNNFLTYSIGVSLSLIVLLKTFNSFVFQCFQGYHLCRNPYFVYRHIQHFLYLRKTYEAWQSGHIELPLSEARRIGLILADRYPHHEQWILPTHFGNVTRSMSTYGFRMYGVDPVIAWTRLMPTVEQDFRAGIRRARANVDLWMNMTVILPIAVVWSGIFYLVLPIKQGVSISTWGFAGLYVYWAILFALTRYTYHKCNDAAVRWGDWIKTAFDLFLPNLAGRLGLAVPATRSEERRQWEQFCQAVVYQSPDDLPPRQHPHERNGKKEGISEEGNKQDMADAGRRGCGDGKADGERAEAHLSSGGF